MKPAQLKDVDWPLKGFLVVSGMEDGAPGKSVVEVAPGALPFTITSYEPRKAWFNDKYIIDPRTLLLLVPFLLSTILVGATYI